MVKLRVVESENLEQKIEEEFHVSRYIIAYKLGLGLIELVLGLGIIIMREKALEFYNNFKSIQLLEDPRDLLLTVTEKVIPYIFANQVYIIFFLIVLGLVKIVGAIGLIYRKHWGVDLLVGLTALMLPFQFYNLIFEHSIPDLFYIIFGILIALYLINFQPQEYAVKLKHRIKRRVGNK